MSETDLRGILSVISRGNSHPKDGVALWLEVSVFWMGFDAPHYAFRRFLITPARKFRILAHTNPTSQRGL